MYIRLSFIILGTFLFLASPVVSAPVGSIYSSYSVDRSTKLNDKSTDDNNSIKMLFNYKTNNNPIKKLSNPKTNDNQRTVITAKTSEKTTNSSLREICSLFKFSNFEKILCFNVSWNELNNFEV